LRGGEEGREVKFTKEKEKGGNFFAGGGGRGGKRGLARVLTQEKGAERRSEKEKRHGF